MPNVSDNHMTAFVSFMTSEKITEKKVYLWMKLSEIFSWCLWAEEVIRAEPPLT